MIDRLIKKFVPSIEICLKDVRESTHVENKPTTLELHHMRPVFIALFCTLAVSVVINIAEIFAHRFYTRRERNWK